MSDVRSDYALEMRGVSKRFPGTLAVDNVSFYVKKGEVHAIVGEKVLSRVMRKYNSVTYEVGTDLHCLRLHRYAQIH